MIFDPEFDLAVNLIYEAALFPERLLAILEYITEYLQGDTCHLVGWSGGTSPIPSLSLTTGLDEGIGATYAAHYATLDPRRQIAVNEHKVGDLMLCHQYFSKQYVSRSEFFQDYLLPIGIHYALATNLIDEPNNFVQIAFHRYVGHEHFTEKESLQFKRLMPHLQRAIKIILRQQSQQNLINQHVFFTNHSPYAMLALTASGVLVDANQQAEAMLRSGNILTLENGKICAKKPEDQALLASTISHVALKGSVKNIKLFSRNGNSECLVTMLRMPELQDSLIRCIQAEVICLISTGGQRRIASAKQLIEMFGLSPAEARLARAISSGEDSDSYSKHQGIKPSTVKTQLQSIFAKMHIENQKDLIRKVLSLAVAR